MSRDPVFDKTADALQTGVMEIVNRSNEVAYRLGVNSRDAEVAHLTGQLGDLRAALSAAEAETDRLRKALTEIAEYAQRRSEWVVDDGEAATCRKVAAMARAVLDKAEGAAR